MCLKPDVETRTERNCQFRNCRWACVIANGFHRAAGVNTAKKLANVSSISGLAEISQQVVSDRPSNGDRKIVVEMFKKILSKAP